MAAVSRRPVPEEKAFTCEASTRREKITILHYPVIIVDTAKVAVRVEVRAEVAA
jgi:hypothetical protein